jgi:hypothetical protein
MKRLTLYTAIMLFSSTALSNALSTPSNLKATPISSTQIRLNWLDNSGYEAGFRVARSFDGTHFWLIASTRANATSYTDSGLTAGRKSWYKIRAFNSSAVSQWTVVVSATTLSNNPTPTATPTKKIIHWQTFSNSGSVSTVVANHTYIDTLPFDGIVVKFPDYQDCLGPNYSGTYARLYNQLSPMRNLLSHVKHNYAVVLIGNSGMVDPFDDWTAERQRWVNLAMACRDAGLDGFFFDNEEYNVHMWQYPGHCKYASTKTAAQYQEQWRLRGTQMIQAIIAQWPQAKILVTIGPNRSVRAVPAGAMFNGDPNWMGGYFFMGLFAGAPVGGHVISGGELYYNRTVTQFSNWKNFFDTTLTQSPQSPRLMPSSLYSTWTNNATLSFGIYDQDRVGTPAMTYSVLRQTIVNAMPYVDEFVWNYSENLDWLTPGAGSEGNWQNAVWSARSQLGLPPP